MIKQNIHKIISILREETKGMQIPYVTELSINKANPFYILISTVLSARTKDNVTNEASKRLFNLADNPYDMLKLDEKNISEAIYPVGFYNTKAKNILKLCSSLIKNYDGKVPSTIEELVKLDGVGRKTANLVITLAFNKEGICVDTHVHRISNRFGYIETKTPFETEIELRKILPREYWIEYNNLLVAYGQNTCLPILPHCTKCRINEFCDKINVEKFR